jgi:putative copper export protein
MPVLARRGEELGPKAGVFAFYVTKRFIMLVWICILLFLATGIPMTLFNPRFQGFDFSNLWFAAIFVKHILFVVMLIGAMIQSFIIRRMSQILTESNFDGRSKAF